MSPIALVLLAAACEIQAEPEKPNPWKTEFKLTLEEKDGFHVFFVEGTTNLPPGTEVKARVYAVDVVNDPLRGRSEDEEPLLWEDDDAQPALKRVEVKDGKFRQEVYRFRRQPWAFLYRGRVHYNPRWQNDDAIVRKVGADDFSHAGDLRTGTEKDFAAQLQDRARDVLKDFSELLAVYKDLKKRFVAHREKFSPADWADWKADALARLKQLQDSNKNRFNLWSVWMERQAKMRVDGMCTILERLLDTCTNYLADGRSWTPEEREEALLRIQKSLDAWIAYYDESVDATGVPMPLDADAIGPIVTDYEKAVGLLRKWLEKPEGDGDEIRSEARVMGIPALLRLPPLLQNRKTAYRFVSELSARFTRLLELAETRPEAVALGKALEEHDAALREFKKLADLK